VSADGNAQHWIERCRAGEPEAVAWLVHTHQAAIYRLALSVLDDPAEADEATQATFLRALRRLGDYRGQAALRTWLYAIALNVSRDRWRRRSTWRRLRQALGAAGWRAPEAEPPEAAAARREAEAAVWQAVQRLDEKHRLPVILRYYHDLPTAEIAQVLGVPAGTVHSRLSAARDRLRGWLAGTAADRTEVEAPWRP
jgi:RNA polymerase sigma-70 factor (ECF subfamily)